ncbi:transporter substrate-binding domain-containing protein [Marinobacter sp. TBZ242]|uniref:Transporter substrate-binding domain-containing protein n=1 Tax=Marinobacter azerbaijanicus TaxID=3050455 RepID=A0ABT7I7U3_9GAMM|nr:transporter substrate-binding domain-containing protein [Marinobacter sp. TBZ242]MDL0430130.1 transporter substrate-binding domain-containing protein [Marinobacter sp. TBZ242]
MVTRFPVLIAGCILVATLIAGLPSVSAAGVEEEVVTFAIPDVWPWAYEGDNGEPQGSLVEVAERLSELTGIPVVPRLRPQRRAIVELRNGTANFTILFQNPQLDVEAINVISVTRVNILLAAMAESEYPLTLSELKGRRVAYIRGTYLGEAFERDADVVKVPVTAISQAVELLSLGRISAILASDHNIYRTLSSLNLNRDLLRYHEHVPGQVGTLYMSRAASRPEAASRFSEAVQQMEADGELHRIFYGRAINAGQPKTLLSSQ